MLQQEVKKALTSSAGKLLGFLPISFILSTNQVKAFTTNKDKDKDKDKGKDKDKDKDKDDYKEGNKEDDKGDVNTKDNSC